MFNLRRVSTLGFGSLLLAATLVASPAGAVATTWYVDNTGVCDNETSDSSVTPYCEIAAALSDAGSGDVVDIGPGTYTHTSGTGGSAVAWVNSKDVDLVGSGIGVTILDGQGAYIGIRIDASSTDISDLTVTDGFSTGSGGGAYALNTAGETVTFTDVEILDSTATTSGGGLMASGSQTTTLTRVTIDGCEALHSSGGGGGLYVASGAAVTVTDSTISNNDVSGAFAIGGGILVETNSSLTLLSSDVLLNNAGADGGGIHLSSGVLMIEDSRISGNGVWGTTDNGGGIYLLSGTATITSTLIADNAATSKGGGIGNGGNATTLNLFSSTITGNQATVEGGGLAEVMGTISGSTITGNSTSGNGGGVTQGVGSPVVKNTIIAGNTALTTSPDCELIDSAGYNLIGDTSGCTISGDGTGNLLDQDPLLGLLADHGGPTLTHALLEGSPAIDAGNPSVPDGTGDACTAGDQRGWDRDVDGGRCDIGAYESLLCAGLIPDTIGTTGHDTLIGTPDADVIAGFLGHDTIDGLGGDDILCGGAGNDTLYGRAGKDWLYGDGKHDILWGGEGKDHLFGGDGRDTLYGEGHHDILKGGRQADILWGGLGSDRMKCGPADDEAYGQKGDDLLWGQRGEDVLHGGGGDDWADGGPHIDTCSVETPLNCP